MDPQPTTSSSARTRLVLNVCAGGLPALLYVTYVWHYSLNVPFDDDWTKTNLVLTALHGRLDFGAMWAQTNEARLFVPNLAFSIIGLIDRFNLRAVVVLTALMFVASYFLFLALFRAYLGRALTPLPILALGVIWFSLADTGNSLWAYQSAWYFVIFFLVAMVCFLTLRPRRRGLGLSLGILAVVAASLSMVQGFALWPVGLVCLLWNFERRRATFIALGAWIAAALVTVGIYLHGYVLAGGCNADLHCSLRSSPGSPIHIARFFLALVGYVVPVIGPWGRTSVGIHQYLGALLCGGAILVIVQALRERRTRNRPPLALAMILFALLFDVSITLGRGTGQALLASQSRFTMANILLVVGLAAHLCAHPPKFGRVREPFLRRESLGALAFVMLALLVVAQTVFTTVSGIAEGRTWHHIQVTEARVVVNRDRLPRSERLCYLAVFVTNGTFRTEFDLGPFIQRIALTKSEGLYMFSAADYRKYRAAGPPSVPNVCKLQSATHLTRPGAGT